MRITLVIKACKALSHWPGKAHSHKILRVVCLAKKKFLSKMFLQSLGCIVSMRQGEQDINLQRLIHK